MAEFGIFYQREGSSQIEHMSLDGSATVGQFKEAVARAHGANSAELVFIEDTEEPLVDTQAIETFAGPRGVKLHVNRCRRVAVTVHFAEKTFERAFAPGATVAKVKRWVAEVELKMSPEEAGEHMLQLAGSTERPRPNTHIGTLTSCPKCSVSFDLVPDQRVNGFSHA